MNYRNIQIRDSVVSGRFYPSDSSILKSMIQMIFNLEEENISPFVRDEQIIGGIVPHAGYMFSLKQAIYLFGVLSLSKQDFDTVVIVNPDHHRAGDSISVDGHDAWSTPLGQVAVDTELADEICFSKSNIAQMHEHSAEVIVPLIQHFLPSQIKILPISMKDQTLQNSVKLAESIFLSSKKLNRKILFIASSDFSHFETPEFGYKQDEYVVKEIMVMNSANIFDKVMEHNISMCGYGPVMSLVEYSKMISDNARPEVLIRGHSGEVTPSDEVVDYISFLFTEK